MAENYDLSSLRRGTFQGRKVPKVPRDLRVPDPWGSIKGLSGNSRRGRRTGYHSDPRPLPLPVDKSACRPLVEAAPRLRNRGVRRKGPPPKAQPPRLGTPGALSPRGPPAHFTWAERQRAGGRNGILSCSRAGCDCCSVSSASPVMGVRGQVNWRPSAAQADRELPPAAFWLLCRRGQSNPPAGGNPPCESSYVLQMKK